MTFKINCKTTVGASSHGARTVGDAIKKALAFLEQGYLAVSVIAPDGRVYAPRDFSRLFRDWRDYVPTAQ